MGNMTRSDCMVMETAEVITEPAVVVRELKKLFRKRKGAMRRLAWLG